MMIFFRFLFSSPDEYHFIVASACAESMYMIVYVQREGWI